MTIVIMIIMIIVITTLMIIIIALIIITMNFIRKFEYCEKLFWLTINIKNNEYHLLNVHIHYHPRLVLVLFFAET